METLKSTSGCVNYFSIITSKLHAKEDGKYTYCFNNEHWGANTKEVSFNVHGIVYVPESEAPQDPLEKEGEDTP